MRGLHPIFADLRGSAWCSRCSVTHLIEGDVILHPTQDPASRTLFFHAFQPEARTTDLESSLRRRKLILLACCLQTDALLQGMH